MLEGVLLKFFLYPRCLFVPPVCSGSQGGSHCLGRKSDNTAVMVPCSEGYEHVSFETPDIVPVATVRCCCCWPLPAESTCRSFFLECFGGRGLLASLCFGVVLVSVLALPFIKPSNVLNPVSFALGVFHACLVSATWLPAVTRTCQGVKQESTAVTGVIA